ncbi:alpha/beta fold hydrolase [Acetobacteraceae bacterium KSS8]|uniref:Alpha/beta fold hydrolase n=1 Tax=Endosaccharibacter trunci TaxID=2812733 RepID=A0ABT1W6C0_9PROT|nr:alpha/beta fold hydrolase [Acetobacteraceae bacterium KSS8]
MRIVANGITLHANETGSGGTSLVFLHYWGGTADTWAPVIDALPSKPRAIALDARGWGGSDRPAEGYSIATMADDVAAFLSALRLERYVLVGHSMGGKVAQLFASRRPDGLVGLVLVAPSPACGKALAAPEREAMKGAYATPEAAAWTVDNVLAERSLPPDLREQVIAGSVAGATAAKEAWPLSAISEDVSADLGRIDVPVLVIGGEKDKVDSVELLKTAVLPALPGAALTVIPGVGHLLPLEAPRDVAEAIIGFLRRLAGETASAIARPESLPAVFDAALNRGDVDGVMALFHPEAVMRLTDGTLADRASGSLRRAFEGLIALRAILKNTVRRVLVSGDIALLLLDWEMRIPGPDGEDAAERGVATQIAERRPDGGWTLRISNPLGIA